MRYTVRVEFHSNQYNPDFEILHREHREMEKREFEKIIKSNDRIEYYLSKGEYNISTSKNCLEFLDSVKEVVQEIGMSAEILVTESNRRRWYGFTEVKGGGLCYLSSLKLNLSIPNNTELV